MFSLCLPQSILNSGARFTFQQMRSFSYQNFLHSWIKSILLSLAFIDFSSLALVNLYGLITLFSNYSGLGFCQINLLSSNLFCTFYLGSCHSYHKRCLELPWQGSSVGKSIIPMCQDYGFHSQWGHIQESPNMNASMSGTTNRSLPLS